MKICRLIFSTVLASTLGPAASDIFEDIKRQVEGAKATLENIVEQVEGLPNTFEDQFQAVENFFITEVKNPATTEINKVSNALAPVGNELGKISTKVEEISNEVKTTISSAYNSVTSIDIEDFETWVAELNALERVALGAESFYNEATTIDQELVGCLRQLTGPAVAGAADDLGEFGEKISDFVKEHETLGDILDGLGKFGTVILKALTEILRPKKCMLCARVLSVESLRSCGCSTDDRRLSNTIWHAAVKYGPESNPHMNNDQEKTSSTGRQLASSPVNNDLRQCPHAPEESQTPAYSSKYDISYTGFLGWNQIPMFPNMVNEFTDDTKNCANFKVTREAINTPNADNDYKWDGRTNQNICAIIQTQILPLLDAALEGMSTVCEAMPAEYCGGICISNPYPFICWHTYSIVMLIKMFFDQIDRAIGLHDAVVDGAEIEATLVNTEKLTNWTCSFEKMMTEKFDSVRGSLSEAISGYDKPNVRDKQKNLAIKISIETNKTKDLFINEHDALLTKIASRTKIIEMLLKTDLQDRPGYNTHDCTNGGNHNAAALCPLPKK